jgi:hypothetical protein
MTASARVPSANSRVNRWPVASLHVGSACARSHSVKRAPAYPAAQASYEDCDIVPPIPVGEGRVIHPGLDVLGNLAAAPPTSVRARCDFAQARLGVNKRSPTPHVGLGGAPKQEK